MSNGPQIKLHKCPHNIKTRHQGVGDFHCTDCDLEFEEMADGTIRQLCEVCGGRHWR